MASEGPKTEYFIKLGDKHKLSISVFKNQDGDPVLNLRKFFLTSDGEEWRPDRQGLTMRMDQQVKLRKAIKALSELDEDDVPEADFGDKKKGKNKEDKKGTKSSKTNKKSKKQRGDDDEDD
jgi:hypothetical protein